MTKIKIRHSCGCEVEYDEIDKSGRRLVHHLEQRKQCKACFFAKGNFKNANAMW